MTEIEPLRSSADKRNVQNKLSRIAKPAILGVMVSGLLLAILLIVDSRLTKLDASLESWKKAAKGHRFMSDYWKMKYKDSQAIGYEYIDEIRKLEGNREYKYLPLMEVLGGEYWDPKFEETVASEAVKIVVERLRGEMRRIVKRSKLSIDEKDLTIERVLNRIGMLNQKLSLDCLTANFERDKALNDSKDHIEQKAKLENELKKYIGKYGKLD